MKTRREKIAELLTQQALTPSEISKIMEIPINSVLEDLKHIARSRKYGRMLILPAKCNKCGFEFKPDFKVPKKCPKCKSTWISEPKFILQSDSKI